MQFLISIITINYNNCKGLYNTINSVLNQSVQEFEFIIIDGGSVDGSVDIIKQNENKIKYWISEVDQGIYHAMNKGINEASGDFLIFLNSGDYLNDDDVISKCYDFISKFPEIDIFYGDIFMLNSNLKVKKEYPDKLDFNYFKRTTINHQASIFKAELFKEFGFYPFEQYKLASDYWLYLKSMTNNKFFRHLSFPMVVYDESGISSINMESYIGEMEIIWQKLVSDNISNILKENENLKAITEYKIVNIAIKLNNLYQSLKK